MNSKHASIKNIFRTTACSVGLTAAMAMVPMTASAAQPTPLPNSGHAAVVSPVNFRTGPSTHYHIIRALSKNTDVTLTGATNHGWAPVTIGKTHGWVSAHYLKSINLAKPVTTHKNVARVATNPAISTAPSTTAAKAIAYAKSKLGSPYVYGASGPNAFDCSGLTSAAYHAAGKSIPRTSYEQLGSLHHVSLSALQPGDIVGFYGGGHVGIYIGNGQVIHAPHTGDVVRVASMNNMHPMGAVRP